MNIFLWVHKSFLELLESSLFLSSFDGSTQTCDREGRRFPVALLLPYTLLPVTITKQTREETFAPNTFHRLYLRVEICLLIHLRLILFRSQKGLSKEKFHQTLALARDLPPPVRIRYLPSLISEQSEAFPMIWSPSLPFPMMMMTMTAQNFNLICLKVVLLLLGHLTRLGPLCTSPQPNYKLYDPTYQQARPRSVSLLLLASRLILLTLRWCFDLKGVSLQVRCLFDTLTSLWWYYYQWILFSLQNLPRVISEEQLYVKPNLFVILLSPCRDQLRLSRISQLVICIPDISFIFIAHQPIKPRCVYFHHRTSLISVMFQHPVLVGRRLLPSRVDTSYSLVGLMVPLEGLNFLKNFDDTQSLICFSSSRTVFEWYRQFSNWYTKAYPEESTHRISLTAGSYPGPLLASCPVVVSRTHGNSFFLVEIASIENSFRFGSSNVPPSLFSMMLCFYGLIYRRLISYLETTSMNWLCEYLLQILLVNSSITDFDENMFFLTLCLMPVRLEYMEFYATSQCQLIRTIHHFAELIANVAAALLDLASDLMLCSRLRVFWNMRSQFLCAISLYHYAITFVVSRLALAKTLSFVISFV